MPDTLSNESTDFVVRLGSALVASGAPVGLVEDILTDVSARLGLDVGYSILPTGLIALGRDGKSTLASIASSDPATLRFDQTTALFQLVSDTRDGVVDPIVGSARLTALQTQPRQSGVVAALLGHATLTVGLALLLDPSWGTVAVVAVLGLLVGAMKLGVAPHRTLLVLLPSVAAFVVAAGVFLLRRHGTAIDGLQTLIPPLVTFLPGATLTVGAIELSEGSIVTGSSRLIAGLLQLMLLAFGIVVAATIVKIPASVGLVAAGSPRIGTWAPWLGVLLFGVGAAIFYSAFLRTYPALLAVLYATHIGQFATSHALGAYLSAAVGAAVGVLVASAIHRHLHGPPALISFLPAFWLLVPGVLGLVGLTRLAVGDTASEDITTTLFTILAIALGVIVGLGLDQTLARRIPRR